MFSDGSSIMGDRWYDSQSKKGIDFKFEVNSAVDSIEFPMNQNLNLKLNLKSIDNGDLANHKDDEDMESCDEDLLQLPKVATQKSTTKAPAAFPKFQLKNVKPFDQLFELEESSDNDRSGADGL